MKKVFFTISCLLLCITFTQSSIVFASNEAEKSSYYTQFDLLETYLVDHKQKILLFQEKYNITQNLELDTLLTEIENLTIISKKIKFKDIEGYDSSEISAHIIKRIKYINEKLRITLTEEKNNYQEEIIKKHSVYSNIWIKAWNHLIKIIKQLANTVVKSDISIENKMKIVVHLKNLQENSQKLIDFENSKYENIEKIQEDFIYILKEIRWEMWNIKEILKK